MFTAKYARNSEDFFRLVFFEEHKHKKNYHTLPLTTVQKSLSNKERR